MPGSLIKKLKIIRVIPETPNAKTFVLEPMEGWSPVYKAGQFLTLVFDTATGEKRRSFSIVSSPVLNEPLAITVKKLDNGEFSRLLLIKSKEGDILFTSGIGGFFTLPEVTADKQYVFLAAGSGITPCFSLIKTLLATTKERIVLIYSNRSEEETIFYKELESLHKEYGERLILKRLFSNATHHRQRHLAKWLLQELLEGYLPEKEKDTRYYLCGPESYMLMAAITLKTIGVLPSHIIQEDFNSRPRRFMPVPPDTDPHWVTLHIGEKTWRLQVQYPKSILTAAKENELTLPYSCETGRCGSCVARCVSGKIWMAYNEVLMEDEISKGLVLTCVGYPIEGDAEIFFDTIS
jgi:ring-1,2-phenylacetyl-CoA epoxidase subunit PaaE